MDEASDVGVVVAGVVVVEAGFAVELLSGVEVVDGDAEVEFVADFAVGGVLDLLDDVALSVGDDVGPAEVIRVVIQDFPGLGGGFGERTHANDVLGVSLASFLVYSKAEKFKYRMGPLLTWFRKARCVRGDRGPSVCCTRSIVRGFPGWPGQNN